jgi:DNA-directed RNA polymerase specialized sigma24 family protein
MNYNTDNPNLYDNIEAVERLKVGDSQAWRDFVSHYSRRLRYDILISLMKRSLPDESLHDIEQDTWLTAANKMSSFMWRGDGSLYNWLRAISLNHILGRIPRIKQRRLLLAIEEIDDFDCDGNFALDEF